MLLAESTTDGASVLLLIPAGLAIVARGVLMLVYTDRVLVPLARREAASPWAKFGMNTEYRYGAALLVVIGLGWMLGGAVYGL
ncbi:MAG TPA: hypothetical protein VHF88_09165 [Thermoleophilaceae bacterium]|nr:hypothetical protein [Thermoleophilaceae bacterium]